MYIKNILFKNFSIKKDLFIFIYIKILIISYRIYLYYNGEIKIN